MTADPTLCFVEAPRGSRNTYEFDAELDAIKLDRFLFSSVVRPHRLRLRPKTLAVDPLGVMVYVSGATFPGGLIEGKILALFLMRDDSARTTTCSASRAMLPTGTTWIGLRTCPSPVLDVTARPVLAESRAIFAAQHRGIQPSLSGRS